MNNNYKIGIIGCGFVGGTMARFFKEKANQIEIFDKFVTEKSTVQSLDELLSKVEFVFVCVPSPMILNNGSCDTSIVKSVLKELSESKEIKHNHVVIIRSTIPPGTSDEFAREYKNLNIVFQPEFLTEKNADQDFAEQTRIVLGGDLGLEIIERKASPMTRLSMFYRTFFKNIPILTTNRKTAEMVKYVTNCFLAMKVSFANEMYQICSSLNLDYDQVMRMAKYDTRLGESHLKVPGQDGKFGWGLSCFPKDINALMFCARQNGVDPKVLQAVWDKNLEVRTEENRDWLSMPKAVSNSKNE